MSRASVTIIWESDKTSWLGRSEKGKTHSKNQPAWLRTSQGKPKERAIHLCQWQAWLRLSNRGQTGWWLQVMNQWLYSCRFIQSHKPHALSKFVPKNTEEASTVNSTWICSYPTRQMMRRLGSGHQKESRKKGLSTFASDQHDWGYQTEFKLVDDCK